MTEAIVRGYFLKAGASFRKSSFWDQESKIAKQLLLRSGRFGVGALSIFLLGDEFELITRHAAQPESEGVRLHARLDTPQIELTRETRNVLGTTIRVKLRPHILERLTAKDGQSWN